MPPAPETRSSESHHAVQLFDSSKSLVDTVGEFLRRGLGGGENVLIVEVFYTVHPYLFSVGWLSPTDQSIDIRSVAIYRPRWGTLTTLSQ